MKKCPECGSKIEDDTKYYTCLDDKGKNCDYRISKVKFKKQNQHWLKTTIDDEALWYKPIFDADIPIISAEYKRLYELCEEKQSFGMLLEIKDIFEILIKFPTLLTVSAIYQKNAFNEVESKLLISMLEKQLSLGTWATLASTAKGLQDDSFLKSWLSNITKVFNNHSITQWRNEEIGHGALSLDETSKFQEDIKSKLSILKIFFEENISTLFSLKESNYQELMETIFFEKDEQSNIYFFDSYDSYAKKKKTSRVDYKNGIYCKKIENEFTSLANSLSISESTNRLEGCADSGIREATAQKMLEELHKVDDYETPTYLVDWLKSNMIKHTKGLFLLQMQRGMGKSMFSRALDQLSLAKIKMPNTLVRAYYVNDVYSYKLDEFKFAVDRRILNKQLVDSGMVEKADGSAIPKSLDSESQAKDFTNMLKQYKKVYGERNILFIIDGLDEVPDILETDPYTKKDEKTIDEKTILDILPLDDNLPEGVFILLTSRVNLLKKIQTKLDDINFTDKNCLLKDNSDYISNTNAYIKKYIKKDLDDKTLALIRERSDNRYVYIKLIKGLMKNTGLEIEDIPNADKIMELYLNNLNAKYGEKFFTNIINILAIISTQYEPLTLKEIAYILQDECINFKLLAWINDTRGFFKFSRSDKGTTISLEHADIKLYLTKNKSVLNAMESTFNMLIENIIDKEYEVDFQVDGEVYLLSYIWNYTEKLNKFENFSYIEKIMDNIEKIKSELFLNKKISIYSHWVNMLNKKYQLDYVLYENIFAKVLMNYGKSLESILNIGEAARVYGMAAALTQNLYKKSIINSHQYELSGAFISRGNTYLSLNNSKDALADYHQAIEVLTQVWQNDKI